jgi:ATP-grasp domain, R2K clade family 3
MNDKYKNIQWVVQSNLTGKSEFEDLKNACIKLGIGFLGLNIIPFSNQLPEFDKTKQSIIYGSTTFNALAFASEQLRHGVFFDELNFSIQNYINKWGKYMLNYGASVTTFKDLAESKEHQPDKLLFIRPDDDSKSFSGTVIKFEDINQWYQNIISVENISLSFNSKIIVSEPYNIKYDWRLWIVEKKVVAASKYREYFKLKKEEGCPADVISFAEARCREYSPHDIFVMDVCLCGDEYYIVECGCMNGTGFYKANIESILSAVSDYFVSFQTDLSSQ